MQVQTSCGHSYARPWQEGLIRYGVFFYCEICGLGQAFPLDQETNSQYAETVEANVLYAQLGWPLIPPTLKEAIRRAIEQLDPAPGELEEELVLEN